jgi:hypothetical protein
VVERAEQGGLLMRMIGLALAGLVLATSAHAATVTCAGNLLTSTPLGALNAISQHVAVLRGTNAVAFQAMLTGGTATVQLQICCIGSCDAAGGAWAAVEGSDMAITPTVSLAKSIANPTCGYRAVVTACAACAGIQVGFACAGP